MINDLAPVLILWVIFWGITAVIREASHSKIRQQIVDKGLNNVNVQNLFPPLPFFRIHSSLKWGILLIGVGLVLLVRHLVPIEVSDEATIGAMLVVAGVCLLVFYFIAPKIEPKAEEKKTGR
jgi:hypothetical protein